MSVFVFHSQTENLCCCLSICFLPVASSSYEEDETPESSPPVQRWDRSADDPSVGETEKVYRESRYSTKAQSDRFFCKFIICV